MRFLGIGDYCELGALYLKLLEDGHEVKVYSGGRGAKQTLRGLVPRTADWRRELKWVKAAGAEGMILFENADAGALQDELRREGYNVIGGSSFGDRLESDRAFGQELLRRRGIKTARNLHFSSFQKATAHIRRHPGRYVYKPSGSASFSMESYVGQLGDGADVIDFLNSQSAIWKGYEDPQFILMEHLEGIEVGVGAYFNGEAFLEPACIDFEHKRFFAGDMGEMTGEMGTLVSYDGAERIFSATLAKVAPQLAKSGYVGYINLNTIVNQRGIWPLEFTSRFGYPGFAILSALQQDSWATLFQRMCQKSGDSFKTQRGYAVGVVLTVPPFPYVATTPRSPTGLRVHFRADLTARDRAHLHYGEVALKRGELVTAGVNGLVMVVTGTGPTAAKAKGAAYDVARKVAVPNMRYRLDIADRFIRQDGAQLKRWKLM